ncbi:MAG: tRNA pseudouridine synthase A [Clostridium sp.]
MKRVKLVVAYDGTNYRGWQVQNNGETIESMLNRAISSLTGEEIHVMGSSRTDSGVHAMGNVAVFDTEARMAADKFSYALNQRLPEDIRIQNSCEVPLDFHPRYQKTVKTYEYHILNREFPLPAYRLNAAFYVSASLMMCTDAGGGCLSEGEHDFQSLCSRRPGENYGSNYL